MGKKRYMQLSMLHFLSGLVSLDTSVGSLQGFVEKERGAKRLNKTTSFVPQSEEENLEMLAW